MNLSIFNEIVTNGFTSLTLSIITIAAILCGIFVIVCKNPIVSVLYLIGLFLSIAIYLMLLGINFIGLSYLLVYVGAVSILFLFILMLINIRISEIISTSSNNIPLAIFIGTLFFYTVYEALPLTINFRINLYHDFGPGFEKRKGDNIMFFFPWPNIITTPKYYEYENQPLGFVSSQYWDTLLAEYSYINTLGNILYTSFPLWLLLTSLILLLAMVGAIVITLKNK